MSLPVLAYAEVAKHCTADDLWLIVEGKVYDCTGFAPEHPGGEALIHKYSGRDGTKEFLEAHPVNIISLNGLGKMCKGTIEPGSVPAEALLPRETAGGEAPTAAAAAPVSSDGDGGWEKPDVDTLLNLFDVEHVAQKQLLLRHYSGDAKKGKGAWDYYSSGADDEITLRENHSAFQRIWMRPRVMRDVSVLDTSCEILGYRSSCPIYLSAVAVQKLGHPDGEVAWTKAAHAEDVIFMVPTLSSCSLDEIEGAKTPEQTFFFQLYVNRDRDTCRQTIEKAEAAGCKAIFITCDAPQLGRRERDMRNKAGHGANAQTKSKDTGSDTKSKGQSEKLTQYIDPSLSWEQLPWFQSVTKLPIILKGIQTAEDAVKALDMGCAGVVLSNHGGRQLDFARSGIEVLPEVMAALKKKKNYSRRSFSVFVDGGIRRGTDVFKAMALGATAVGIGKPVAYGMSAYGQAGVEKVIQMLKGELRNAMRLSGCPSLKDIKPEMVITDHLHDHGSAPRDSYSQQTYLPLQTADGIQETKQLRQRLDAQAGQIATLVAALGKAPAASLPPPPFLDVAGALLCALVGATLSTIFTPKGPVALSRTAVTMSWYLLLHLLGVLQYFGAGLGFSEYYTSLSAFRAFRYFEYYLLLAAAVHVLLGLYFFLFKYKRLNAKVAKKGPGAVLSTGKLFFTGIATLALILLHLKVFRFPQLGLPNRAGSVFSARAHASGLQEFSSPGVVAVYCVGTVSLGLHLHHGWAKTVNKLGLEAAMLQPVRVMGQNAVALLCLGFMAVPLSVYTKAGQKTM